MNGKILVVEDDVELAEMLGLQLSSHGYEVISAGNGQDALRSAYDTHPDLILLDLIVPGIDGFEVCRRLRELSTVPIIILSARTDDQDMIQGFKAGADDYVKKPFSFEVLGERIAAILKRTKITDHECQFYEDDALTIDLNQQQVMKNGRDVHLTPTEYRLLSTLVRRRGQIVSHNDLLSEVWGPGYLDATASLSVYIHYLRRKLEDFAEDHRYIRSRWGVGYWFATKNA